MKIFTINPKEDS
jgi:hypothetical protein